MSDELKPCPFCGSDGLPKTNEFFDSRKNGMQTGVFCAVCLSRAESIHAWNRRPNPAPTCPDCGGSKGEPGMQEAPAPGSRVLVLEPCTNAFHAPTPAPGLVEAVRLWLDAYDNALSTATTKQRIETVRAAMSTHTAEGEKP